MASKKIGINQFQVLPQNKLVTKFLELFESALPGFPHSQAYQYATTLSKNERSHSDGLAKYWNFNFGTQFILTTESPQPRSRAVDFDVTILGGVRILTIEAKLFPIPVDPKRNAWEYVYGDGGGMERFKNEKHGFDYDGKSLFLDNALVGYVLSGQLPAWEAQVNDWIILQNHAGWPISEQLQEISSTPDFARYKSEHTRTGGSQLILHHFWVKV